MNELSNNLLKDAVNAGLCAEHTAQWDSNWSQRDLVAYYKANPNWCLERHFPSLSFLKEHFDNSEVRDMGVYVNSFITIKTIDLSYIFINCKVGAIVTNVTRLYFGLDSIAKIVVEHGADLVVDSYDNAELEIELRGSARCIVYQYGSRCPKITGSNNYKVKKK
jgi:hypothetical protein